MDQEDEEPKFIDFIPTLRGYYAYLKCGRYILQVIFLWIQQLPDIPNVEKYLLESFRLAPNKYSKYFTSTMREIFKNNGISKIDITAIFRMFNTVNGFFKDTEQPWSELEYLLNKIKDERNEIVHTLLMKEKIQDDAQLNEYLNSCGNHMEQVIIAFEEQFGGYATEQQRMDAKQFVKKVIDEVRTQDIVNIGIQNDNNLNIAIQHDGPGAINVQDRVNIDIQHQGTGNINDPEDIATYLVQQIFNVAGKKGSLSIHHYGSGDINFSQEFYNITGGNPTFNI